MSQKIITISATCMALLLLVACSGGSGGGGSEREVDISAAVGSGEFIYDGPPPASEEIQGFKRSFYDPLSADDRCGQCHTPGGTGSTSFVDQLDVNAAWPLARTVVNLLDPEASAVVRRVSDGHNCWLGAAQSSTCAATIVGYIERWADDATEFVTEVKLLPRIAVSPGGSRSLPASWDEAAAMGLPLDGNDELLGLLNRYCSNCHSDTAAIPQSPYFASASPVIAYDALQRVIDLVDPDNSRIVLRLDPESHNCWDSCPDNANTLSNAVANLAAQVPLTEVNPDLLITTAQVLESDGIIANSGGRFDTSLIAKWEFREGSGTTTADTSGVQPEVPLTLSGEYSWLGSWGVRFVNGKAQGSVSGSSKMHKFISGAGEYSLEAWVAPGNVSQEDAWILGYAGGPESRNFLLSQTLYNYEAYNRSTVTEDNNGGAPALATNDDDERAQATLQHVVVTYDPIDGRKIYVNGEFTGDIDEQGGGLLNNWSEIYAVVLGNATNNDRPWAGTVRMAAIHSSALTPEQVLQNFDVGVGQKYYLMFSVSELLNLEGNCHVIEADQSRTNYCYIVFQASQFDDNSYLFEEPFFANINPSGDRVDFEMEGIRLGINGKLASVGQGFVNVGATINTGQGELSPVLASVGSIIPLENGGEQDVFFLAFDRFEGEAGPALDGPLNGFRSALVGGAAPDIGMRTFDEVNATFSALTGVPVASPVASNVTGKTVGDTYATIRRQLPSVEDFQAFMSSHHMAATQLAAAYCDALVQDVSLREKIFPAASVFNFSAGVSDPNIDWRNHVVVPLVDRVVNKNLLSDTARDRIVDELEMLITDDRDLKPYVLVNGVSVSDPNPAVHNKRDGLIYCVNNGACPASRRADVVKAVCTAVLGSAAALMQ
jgi:hypothetical protein